MVTLPLHLHARWHSHAMATSVLRKHAHPLMAAGPSLLSSLRLSLLSISSSPVRFSSQASVSESDASSSYFRAQPGVKILDSYKEEFEIGSRIISFETGKIARFANGAVVISMDDTHVLSTVASAKSGVVARDFLPLTVWTLSISKLIIFFFLLTKYQKLVPLSFLRAKYTLPVRTLS